MKSEVGRAAHPTASFAAEMDVAAFVTQYQGMTEVVRPNPNGKRVFGSKAGVRARIVDGRTPIVCGRAHWARWV